MIRKTGTDGHEINRKMGQRIAKLREERKITQQILADMVGVSASAIHHYEKGNNGMSVETAVAIARAFNVSLDELVLGKRRL